jgi:serine/threonine protein kinase
MHIKITDFGTAKLPTLPTPPTPGLIPSTATIDSTPRTNSFVGTAEYVPPELLNERSAVPESDLWSLGCVIFQLLAGRPPFKAGNEYQTFQKILKMDYKVPDGFSAYAGDLIRRLLVERSEDRLGANGAWDEIKNHPFFAGVPWGRLDGMIPPMIRSGIPLEAQTPRRTDSGSDIPGFEELEKMIAPIPIPPRGDSGMLDPNMPEPGPRSASLNSLTGDDGPAPISQPIARPVPPRNTSRPLTMPNGPIPPQLSGLPQRPNTMLLSHNKPARQPGITALPDPLATQRDPASPYYIFTLSLDPNEKILRHSPGIRRRAFFGLFSPPPRPLILTTKPRLLAFRPDDHRRIKEQLDLSLEGTVVELVDAKKWVVRSRKGDWVLEDAEGGAQSWVDAVRRARAGV